VKISPRSGAYQRFNLDKLESTLEDLEKDLRDLNGRGEGLVMDRTRLLELQHVLSQENNFFAFSADMNKPMHDSQSVDSPLLEDGFSGHSASTGVQFITGLVPRERVSGFERMVFRATRGNAFMRFQELEEKIMDPQTREMTEKNVFIVFFHGERLRLKISKICESFGANLYPYPKSSQDAHSMRAQVSSRLDELGTVVAQTDEQRSFILSKIVSMLDDWKIFVAKEKAIYHILNFFDFETSPKTVAAEGWCPRDCLDSVQMALSNAEARSNAEVRSIMNVMATKETPPTFFESTEFTKGFQGIVDAYGTARYKELNPGVFSIITFPFLFAVMFGDCGHGFIMWLVALLMILMQEKLKKIELNEMVQMCFHGRYVLFMMGLFSMFTGSIYNDYFALSADFFGTKYDWHEEEDSTGSKKHVGNKRHDEVYPYGVDPAWFETENKLTFYNSLKMKLSIILGVLHMTIGVIMSLFNHLHRRDYLNVFFEFIPQFVFITSTFGYMTFMVIYKWCQNYAGNHIAPPSLLQTMTDFFLSPGSVKDQLYAGQGAVQAILVLLAFISVPCMLFPKPYILRSRHRKMMSSGPISTPEEHVSLVNADSEGGIALEEIHPETGEHQADSQDDDTEEFVFSDVIVVQIIHTIEYVLGCISNTASYLRLWALSLAHAELSEVFWNMILLLLIKGEMLYGVMTYIGFAGWAFVTVSVLLCMEALSAFLHALRLHWVEFMNKFYKGDGYAFAPFSLADVNPDSNVPLMVEK
jgi:V-type H+-transporting ATPase subunit a